jgi:hypothetical protein
MKRRRIYVGFAIIAVIAIAGCWFLKPWQSLSQPKTSQTSKNSGQVASQPVPTQQLNPKSQSTANTSSSSAATTTGQYASYNDAAFSSATGVERVLFFYSAWNPQSHALDIDIKEHQLPTDMAIFRIDYDNNQSLRQKYGVTVQNTIIKVDANGNKVKSVVANDKPTYAFIRNSLEL